MQTLTRPARLERNLGWIALLLLLIGCLLVLRPFASALLWAVVLCVSSWPLYQRLLKLLRGRRTWAALLMALGMILVMLLPFLVVGLTLADNVKELTSNARTWLDARPPAPPAWLAKVPAVGQQATERWQIPATIGPTLLAVRYRLVEEWASAETELGRGTMNSAATRRDRVRL